MKATSKITILSVTLFCFAFVFAGCQTSKAQKSASVDLFNGKDFTGWTFYMRTNADPMKTWSISDGMVHCTGKPTGYMRTIQSYSNYVVTAEWRLAKDTPKPVNTGVCVFMQDRDPAASPKDIWGHCIECQGMHDHMGDFWLHGGATVNEPVNMGKTGIKMLQPSNESPLGEWTTFQCICRGNTVEIIVNGKSMNKVTGSDFSSGYIGIQSEGGAFDLRKVSVELLQ
jgi:hypothetical protein